MKTISTLLIFLISGIAASAKIEPSKLSVNVVGNSTFVVMIDNTRYDTRDNSVLINNLQPGYHSIKIYKTGNFNNNRNRNNRNSGRVGNANHQLVYSSSIIMKPRHHVDITINRFGKALVDERVMKNNQRDDDWDYNDFDDRNDRDDRYDQDDNRYDGGNNYGQVMSDHSFASFRETLRRENFENSRVTLAKDVFDRNRFNSGQIKQILALFSFDNNKLEVAKYAYKNTIDKENYFILYDSFSYSRTKEELSEFVRKYR